MFDEANAPLNPSRDISKDDRVSTLDSDGEVRKVYTLYKSRYLELGLYCLGAMLN
jgi:hypothetical protein